MVIEDWENGMRHTWSKELLDTCATMPDWNDFRQAVSEERNARWLEERDLEAERLASKMDMSAEGYVREWANRCFPDNRPMSAWEHAYAEAGLIEAAEAAGYVQVTDDARGNVSLTAAGMQLLGLTPGTVRP
jgi:hypothetical protein